MNSRPNSPFQNGETPSELSNVLFEHAVQPDSLIRIHTEFGIDQDNPVSATYEGLRKSRELFTELESNYGIKHAGFHPVIGELPSGDTAGYIVSDKIEGYAYKNDPGQDKTDYLETLIIQPEHIPAAIALLQSLSDYWTDKVSTGDDMLTDIFSIDQYIYDPTTDEFVLVDMDPYFVDKSQMKDELQSQMVIGYSGHRLQELAETVLDPRDLEVWQKGMGPALTS